MTSSAHHPPERGGPTYPTVAPVYDPYRSPAVSVSGARSSAAGARSSAAGARSSTPSARPSVTAGERRKRNHPAKTARTVALAGSVAATAALAMFMAAEDGAIDTAAIAEPASAASEATSAALESGATLIAESPTSEFVPDATVESSIEGAAGQATTIDATIEATETTSTTGYSDGTFVGTSEFTKWGDYQVQATIANGQIVSVDLVQAPSDHKSVEINTRAIPRLSDQALTLQDANLDNVSGATWTSRSYKASLQAALDQALVQGTST